jgi:glutamyl/glutaminyl-tRNA synthetase
MHDYDLAARSGGQFILIADDDVYAKQRLWLQSWTPATVVARMVEDLTWLGMAPDDVRYTSEFADLHEAAGAKLGVREPRLRDGTASFHGRYILPPGSLAQADYYHPWFTICRVIDDHALAVDGFHRGEELVGERQLYDYFCLQLGFRRVDQCYLPHVWREGATAKESKSVACTTVRELRDAGYAPQQVTETLLACSRGVPAGGQITLPKGVLRAGKRKRWLRDAGYKESVEGTLASALGKPWEADVRAAAKRMIAEHEMGTDAG